MNRPLLIAGVLALLGVPAHIYGGEFILGEISSDLFPPIPQGDSAIAKQVIRFGWHMVTVDMLVSGLAFLWMSRQSINDVVKGIGLVLSAQWLGWAVVIFILPVLALGSPAALINVIPQGMLCLIVGGLIALGLQTKPAI